MAVEFPANATAILRPSAGLVVGVDLSFKFMKILTIRFSSCGSRCKCNVLFWIAVIRCHRSADGGHSITQQAYRPTNKAHEAVLRSFSQGLRVVQRLERL